MFSLKNKIALVIGGAGKIGFEISCAMAAQGAKVYVASRSVKLDSAISDIFSQLDIESIEMDASKEVDVNRAVEQIGLNYGAIDILVNSSAWRPLTKFMDDSIENWENSMKVNSSAIFVPLRIIGRQMAAKGNGSIINISSIYGICAPPMSIYEDCDFETEPDYPFLKAGCIGISKYFSSYFAQKSVRVNVIAPGGVSNNQPEAFTRRYNERVPMKRMATAKDIAGAAVFLASDESSYVTGIVLPVDGGWSAI
jgi:NAD(P)-dependent dehydrogenase (short-subunit alcohol dehydrogenase family)